MHMYSGSSIGVARKILDVCRDEAGTQSASEMVLLKRSFALIREAVGKPASEE